MIVYAHRGANRELPENTLEAFRLAIDLGADALETDVHVTRDGAVVVHHDATGARTSNVGVALATLTLADVRRWNLSFGFRAPDGQGLVNATFRVPTFDELLEAFPGVRLNVDIKPDDARAARAVVDVVRRHRAEPRVLLTSFHDRVVTAVRASGYRGETGLARNEVLRLLAAPPGTPRLLLPNGDRAQLPLRMGPVELVRPSFVRRLQRLGYAVDFWVVNDPSDARRAQEAEADGIMTDDPRRIVEAVVRASA